LFDLGQVEEAELARRIAERIAAPMSRIRAVIDAIPAHLQPQTSTVALLDRLKMEGHRLYFLSNMPKPYADSLERRNAFLKDFEDGIFSGRVGLMKPGREIFELANQRFGLIPAQTVFIDDHLGNVEAAQRHGWQAVHFTKCEQVQEQLQSSGWLAA
jgi:putative hydrolase of the HAD superfamily